MPPNSFRRGIGCDLNRNHLLNESYLNISMGVRLRGFVSLFYLNIPR